MFYLVTIFFPIPNDFSLDIEDIFTNPTQSASYVKINLCSVAHL